MFGRLAASVLLLAALPACTTQAPAVRPPASGTSAVSTIPEFSIHPLPPSPSPLALEVRSGQVHGLIPGRWEARPLPNNRYPQEGFVASPSLDAWDQGAGTVRGIEAFWVDAAQLEIPSDYYYYVARGPALSSLATNENCHPTSSQVYADNPPELAGATTFSPGDYVVWARGTCLTQGRPTHWAYVVAAPGFGPSRSIGIPTSGLYVVFAVVGSRQGDRLLDEMIDGATFGDVPISQIVLAART
jgi:hypothetical protein